jgi:hypothetical protein
MVTGFTKSKGGEKEYSKLGTSYPNNLDDESYEAWLKDTSADNLKEYSEHNEKEVTQIYRHKVGDGECITYSYSHYRLDKALNETHRFRSDIGKYPIPRGRFSVTHGDFGKQTRKLEEVIAIDVGYSIPFSKKNLEKIKNIGFRADGKTSYAVVTSIGLPITVRTLGDFSYFHNCRVLLLSL